MAAPERKGLYKTSNLPPRKFWDKHPQGVSTRWDIVMFWDHKTYGNMDNVKNYRPKFLTWRGAMAIENWSLEEIRRKYFRDLKGCKHISKLDVWMPKVVPLLSYILEREAIPLRTVSKFLGMPPGYLQGLCRRDEAFRVWVMYWNTDNIHHKRAEAIESRDYGKKSILETIKPESYGLGKYLPFEWNIDVGWKPYYYDRGATLPKDLKPKKERPNVL